MPSHFRFPKDSTLSLVSSDIILIRIETKKMLSHDLEIPAPLNHLGYRLFSEYPIPSTVISPLSL